MDNVPPEPSDGGNVFGDFLAVLPLEGIGVVGILLIFAFMNAKGVIVIGVTHREQMKEKDERNERTEAALMKSLDLNTEQAKTIAKQTATTDLTAHLLEELRKENQERI